MLSDYSIDIHALRRKEIFVVNVRRQNNCIQEAIHQIESKQVDVGFMVTHTFSLMNYRDAFETVAEYKDCVLKAIIQMNECNQGL